MGNRAHFVDHHQNGKGEPIAGALVYIRNEHADPDTEDDLIAATVYAYDSDDPDNDPSEPLTNPLTTGTDGKYEFYLAAAARVDLKIVTPGGLLQDVTRTVDVTRTPNDNGLAATILDAKGDLISATAADTASRLAVGTNNQVLTADSAQATGLKWATPATFSETLPATIGDAKGDIVGFTAADTPARKAVGANDTVLKADSAQTDGLIWEAVAFSELTGTATEAQTATAIQKSIVDAKGDIIVATAADTVVRVAIGTNDHVLTAASGETAGLKWAALPSSGAMTEIASVTLGADAASIDFTSIPGTYDHLLIKAQIRSARAGVNEDTLQMRFNGDTGGNYDHQFIRGSHTTISGTATQGAVWFGLQSIPAATAPAGTATALSIDIPRYAATTFHKEFVAMQFGKRDTATSDILHYLHGGNWRSTAAITQVSLIGGSANLLAGSSATLYGLS